MTEPGRGEVSAIRGRSILLMRVVMTLAMAAAALSGSRRLPPVAAALLAAHGVANLAFFILRPRGLLRQAPLMGLFFFDLVVAVALMLLSGEVRSQFYVPFFLVILLAGLYRNARVSFLIAGVSSGLYVLLVGAEQPGKILEIETTTRMALFFATALLANHLVEEANDVSTRLIRLADEAKLQQDVHRRVEDFYRTLFDESADGIIVASSNGVIREANPRARELLGGADPTGQSCGDILRFNDSQMIRMIRPGEEFKIAPEGHSILNVEFPRSDGRKTACEITHRNFDTGGEQYHLFLLRDVGALRDAQKRMAELERTSVLGQLVASLPHEINNPLTVILGYAQMLQDSLRGQDAARDCASHIHDAAVRCHRVIEGFLQQYKVRPFSAQPTSLAEPTRNAARLLEFHLRYHSVRLERELDEDVMVSGDPFQIEQVLINLMVNAVHAMRGRPRRVLRLAVRGEDKAAIVSVTDTGCGIAPEDLDKLFKRGYTSKEEGMGHGLGLVLCQEIAQRHGGTIGVESVPEQGSTFTLRFPRLARAT